MKGGNDNNVENMKALSMTSEQEARVAKAWQFLRIVFVHVLHSIVIFPPELSASGEVPMIKGRVWMGISEVLILKGEGDRGWTSIVPKAQKDLLMQLAIL